MKTLRFTINSRVDANCNISASFEMIASEDPVENREAGAEVYRLFTEFVEGFGEAGQEAQK